MPGNKERDTEAAVSPACLVSDLNEGYTTSSGPHLRRADLSHEAMRLTLLVHGLQTENPEVAGLLALMLLTDARVRRAPTLKEDLIPLAEQDRTLWDQQQISEGVATHLGCYQRARSVPINCKPLLRQFFDEATGTKTRIGRRSWRSTVLLKRMSDNRW